VWPATGFADVRACLDAAGEGQKLRDNGAYLEARGRFIACAAEECPGEVRKGCVGWLGELDKLIPTVVFGARARDRELSDVRVSVDGVLATERIDGKPVAVDPGEHHFRFERAGEPDIEQTAVLMAGEKERPITVRFGADEPEGPPALPPAQPISPGEPRQAGEKASSSGSSRTTALALGALGLAAFTAGAALDLSGYVFVQQCGGDPSCSGSHERAEVEWRFVAGDVLLGAGLISGVAAWLIWPRAGRDGKNPVALLGVDPRSRYASVGLRGIF
jgi:hypothetical protein